MKNVMVRAWEIAKEAAVRFGGKAKEYFAQALAIAWANYKRIINKYTLELRGDTKKLRTWVAEIVGTHPIYKLDRKFMNKDWDNEYGEKVFRLNDGYYEFYNGKRQQMFKIQNGEYIEMEKGEMIVVFAQAY